MTLEIEKKIKEITDILEKANYDYYNLNKSELEDKQYDALLQELINLEKKYPQYKLPYSPTFKVGGYLNTKFEKIKHSKPMLSLENVFDLTQLKSFYDKINKKNKSNFISELKIDGIAINIKYIKGILYQAITRGNGYFGELITNNIKTIKDIPLKINKEINLEVRGEIFFKFDNFKKINEIQKKENKILFSNPRNAAAGTLRQLDTNIIAKRNLSSFIYSIINPPTFIKTQEDVLIFLKKMGFVVNPHYKIINSFEELIEIINYYENLKKNLNYNIDGIVIKVNKLSLYDSIGYTSKFPKWAIAYKFNSIQGETIIKKIVFKIGRTGVITPIAELFPIIVDGSLISKVSLHNFEYIKKKDIRINDYVLIHKSGSIIPEIIKIIKEKRTNQIPFKMINYCPFCLEKLKKKENEIDYFCLNTNCQEQKIKKIIHFVSKEAMDMNDIGNKTLEIFFKKKIIQNKYDLYNLKNNKKELEKLPFFKQKKINNILNSIEKSKNRPFENVLFALGIKNVGLKIAKLLCKKFKNIENLKKASFQEISQIHEIGYKIAENIVNYFKNEKNIEEIELLKNEGVNFSFTEEHKLETKEKNNKYTFFQNKRIVLTGTFDIVERKKIKNILEKYDAIITKSISSKTNLLICGKKSSFNKIQKAKKLKIQIINEEHLIKILF
ncbi:NAD-dependent DNA ligase LigA ['Cynodon dactylon' phytoplasma]|uniref:NAD-dependent DNA ligase LigA n=1 Tax='Cynodon dactylon' phytoplasma TaxID=295320 RepID=UPI001265BD4A|nr:NAD-dependent DNA ligase LigA ['Cynodon dactylon' phytoplasma]KAB8122041.1 NAD-dependent DNA ligase LigA ['Cynodon dactylon' phytoplasma]